MEILSARLNTLRRSFEVFSKSDSAITAEQMQALAKEITACSDLALNMEFDLAWANRQLNEIVEDAAAHAIASAPPARRRRRQLRVIVGGRA